jgi:hypothetical protein
MRTRDKDKPVTGKASQTISFEVVVLRNLERKAEAMGMNLSTLVNIICRRVALDDENYYRELSKHYYMKFQEATWMKEQAIERKKSEEQIRT